MGCGAPASRATRGRRRRSRSARPAVALSVVDASVVTVLFTQDARHAAARGLFETGQDLFAPALILSETANALWTICRAQSSSQTRALITSYVVNDLPERVILVSDADLLAKALGLAFELDHPVYDCLYLALAVQRDETLYTFDARIVRKTEATRYAARLRVPAASDEPTIPQPEDADASDSA